MSGINHFNVGSAFTEATIGGKLYTERMSSTPTCLPTTTPSTKPVSKFISTELSSSCLLFLTVTVVETLQETSSRPVTERIHSISTKNPLKDSPQTQLETLSGLGGPSNFRTDRSPSLLAPSSKIIAQNNKNSSSTLEKPIWPALMTTPQATLAHTRSRQPQAHLDSACIQTQSKVL